MPLLLVTTGVVNLYFSLCSSMLSRQYSLYSPEVKKYSCWRSDLILFKQTIIIMLLNKSILPVVVIKHNRIYSKNDTIINILLCFLSSGSLKSVHEALYFDCQCHGSCIWSWGEILWLIKKKKNIGGFYLREFSIWILKLIHQIEGVEKHLFLVYYWHEKRHVFWWNSLSTSFVNCFA